MTPFSRQPVSSARAAGLGHAVSYRFKRDDKGWRVFATTKMAPVPVVTDRGRGAIGLDLNADHLAVAETDASGNWLHSWRVPLITYGKSQRQAEAIIGDAVAGMVRYAKEAGKPIVIEKLDFKQKKAALEGESRRYSRMLSSFSYGKVKAYFISRGHRNGVEVFQVNPAYSSVIGRVKFMERYGLTVHQAAALVLGRRLLGAHPPPADLSRWQRRPGRLHRTCKEAREPRMGVLGRDPGAVETGACSATPAGWSPSGPGCSGGLFLRGGLNADPFGVPGRDSRAEPPCTVGAARPPARERVREWLLPVMTIFTTATYWTVCSDSVGQNSREENGGARTAAMTAKLVSRWNPHILSYECLRVPPWLWFRRLPLLHWSATLQFALSHYVGVRVLLSLRSLGLW